MCWLGVNESGETTSSGLFERSEFLIDTSQKKNLCVRLCVRLILVLVWDTRVFD